MRQSAGGQHSTVGMDWRPHTTHIALLAAETKLSGDLRREGGPLWEGGGRGRSGDEQ